MKYKLFYVTADCKNLPKGIQIKNTIGAQILLQFLLSQTLVSNIML